jgi:hypothetical protein
LSTYKENATMIFDPERAAADRARAAKMRVERDTIDRARAEMIELHHAAVARDKREAGAAK